MSSFFLSASIKETDILLLQCARNLTQKGLGTYEELLNVQNIIVRRTPEDVHKVPKEVGSAIFG